MSNGSLIWAVYFSIKLLFTIFIKLNKRLKHTFVLYFVVEMILRWTKNDAAVHFIQFLSAAKWHLVQPQKVKKQRIVSLQTADLFWDNLTHVTFNYWKISSNVQKHEKNKPKLSTCLQVWQLLQLLIIQMIKPPMTAQILLNSNYKQPSNHETGIFYLIYCNVNKI